MISRGRLYWARMPDDPKRARPVLAISNDRRNELATNIVVIPASTARRLGPWHVPLRKGEGGMPRPSVLKCEQITTLPTSRLDDRPIGKALSSGRMVQIRACILRALDFE